MPIQHQIPLGFRFADEISFDTFQSENNAQLIASLHELLGRNGRNYVFMWGKAGSGKSHLMQASIQYVAGENRPVAYLPFKESGSLSPKVLEGLEQMSLVCIDDVDCIAGNAEWEEAIFHLFNRCHDAATSLLISASAIPQAIGIRLKDLESRLSWGITYQLIELNDAQKMRALQKRAHARGMQLNDEVCRYLLSRYSRRTSDLFELLNTLDRESLTEQRKLTIPFVSQFIKH